MIFDSNSKHKEKEDFFINIYKEQLGLFDEAKYRDSDSSYASDCDAHFIEEELSSVKILEIIEDSEGWGDKAAIFSYEDNIYKCEFRDGSYGTGFRFYVGTLVSVKPVEKTIIVYETY